MLYSAIIAVCSQIHTKHTNTRWTLNFVKSGGTYSNHWVFKSQRLLYAPLALTNRYVLPTQCAYMLCVWLSQQTALAGLCHWCAVFVVRYARRLECNVHCWRQSSTHSGSKLFCHNISCSLSGGSAVPRWLDDNSALRMLQSRCVV